MKRLLIVGSAVILACVVIAVIVMLLALNSIARRGIEAGATYALGVPTTLGSASIGVFSGEFGMSKLKVSNPEGFGTPHFLSLGDADVAVSLGSLTKDTIDVPRFALDSIDVHLERKDKRSNYQVILDNLEKLSGPADPAKPPPKEGGGKKLIVRDLTIRDVTVHVDALGLPGASTIGDATGASARVTIPIKEIRLQNVGQTGSGVGGSGVTISQLSGIIVQAVMAATIEEGAGVLPADLLNDLGSQLGDLDGLAHVPMQVGGKAVDAVQKFGQEASKIGGEAGKAAGEAAKEAEKKIEEVQKGIDDLLGGKKKPGGG